jgi:predicted O-methyltransferase YrrM
MPLAQRALHNLRRFPGRTFESLLRLVTPVYRLERRAKRYARQTIDPALYRRLDTLPGMTATRKCYLLYYLACLTQAPGQIVEIGSYKGKSTVWLAEAARRHGRKMTSMDPHIEGSLAEFQRLTRAFELDKVASLHQAYSHDLGRNWAQPISLLWIDGDHRYEGVRQDILDFAPHVTPGGMVVLDDAQPAFPGVVRAIQEHLLTLPGFVDLGRIRDVGVVRRNP